MTDVQVSNARRIVFTALALVAFWVLAFRGYWAASDLWHEFGAYIGSPGRLRDFMGGVGWVALPLVGLSLALIPTGILHTSTENRLLRKPERWVWLAGVGFICAFGCCYSLGEHDAANAYSAVAPIKLFGGLPEVGDLLDAPAQHLAARNAHVVTWFWLLLPIILTTAFVIVSAWRRAVRDAGVAAVGGDECRRSAMIGRCKSHRTNAKGSTT